MSFDWWTFALQTVNALVLVWLLARFLFRPVSRILAERQAAAHAALDEAEAARDAATRALAEAQEVRDATAADRAARIAAAQEEAARQKQALLAAAEAEARAARTRAEADLARRRAQEAHHWHAEAGDLAVEMAARLLSRLPGGVHSAAFLDGLISALDALPGPSRARIGTEGPVVLRAAQPLSEPEQAEARARLTAALGRPVELRVETDPALVAGLELHTPHAIVRNTFRADLDRIAAGLAEETAHEQ
ncbi:F0F1 ATP synthase subunit delta [Maritimibacter alkaliphilus]|uniref:F0F1 ATP synthase subunit delta n=1 Tax=Maritimibacter alkaliphilus TaxID=404236 RepID=UPI001C98E1C5|nr:F0F1 ATP synthase subunit delta [Maritimibacter alkaliphilus]MBY6088753.1 F0F1 ATP synthase subunit delta [Maritimibacter alkaliphilus]